MKPRSSTPPTKLKCAATLTCRRNFDPAGWKKRPACRWNRPRQQPWLINKMSEALPVRNLENAHREIEQLRKELRQAMATAATTREEAQQKICEFAREFRISLTTVIGFSDILSANDKSHSPEWSQIAIAGHELAELIENLESPACLP